jgi:hypothetical protein
MERITTVIKYKILGNVAEVTPRPARGRDGRADDGAAVTSGRDRSEQGLVR